MTVSPESRIASYQRLLILSQVLASTLDLFALLDLIVNAARDLTRTEATSILLLDAKSGQLYFEAVTGSKSEEIKRIVVPPDSVASQYGFTPGLRDRMHTVHDYFDTNDGKITGIDYNLWVDANDGGFAMSKDEFLATMKYTLDQHLAGNRTPMMFGAHSEQYSSKYTYPPRATAEERQQALEEFINYALSKPEVRIVSNKQILDWIRNPVPIN